MILIDMTAHLMSLEQLALKPMIIAGHTLCIRGQFPQIYFNNGGMTKNPRSSAVGSDSMALNGKCFSRRKQS